MRNSGRRLGTGAIIVAATIGAWWVSSCSKPRGGGPVAGQGNNFAALFEKDSKGNYLVSWDFIQETWIFPLHPVDNTKGEFHHHLLPDNPHAPIPAPVYADIVPYMESPSGSEENLYGGRILARIHVDGDYPRLGLVAGDNYYGVYVSVRTVLGHEFKTWHPVVLAKEARSRDGRFVYTKGPKRLSPAALQCKERDKLLGCFIDNRLIHISSATSAASGKATSWVGLLWIRLTRWFRAGDESQPWIACPELGCCCGGDSCHT